MTKPMQTLSEQFELAYLNVQQRWERLTQREQIALLIMGTFLGLVLLVALVWLPYQAAQKQQQRLTDLKATAQWMQSHVAQLSSTSDQSASLTEKVQRLAQQQGLVLQLQEDQQQIRVSTAHSQYAVLANFLTQLTAQGVSIVSLTLQKQTDGSIQLTLVGQ